MTLSLVIDGSRSEQTREFGPLFEPDPAWSARAAAVSDAFTACARTVLDLFPDGPVLSSVLLQLAGARREALAEATAAVAVVPLGPVDAAGTAVARAAAHGQGLPAEEGDQGSMAAQARATGKTTRRTAPADSAGRPD